MGNQSASLHSSGWTARPFPLRLPVVGEPFFLTSPLIERAYRTNEVLLHISGNPAELGMEVWIGQETGSQRVVQQPVSSSGSVPAAASSLQALQLGTHFGRALITEFPVLLQCPVDDVLQFGLHIRIQPDRSDRGVMQNRIRNHSRAFSAKGQGPRGHLVEHHTK